MKERFTKELVLAVPDLDLKMRIKVDVSDYAIGEMLSIECNNRKWKPVMFLLKFLNKAEKNYKIYNKKMLTVIRGVVKLEALVRRC